MVDHLEQLARTLHRAGGDEEASQRLLELAAVATMQATTLDALRGGPPAAKPEARRAAVGRAPARLAA